MTTALVQVLPTHDQVDALAAVVADALGSQWLTSVQGLDEDRPDDYCEVPTDTESPGNQSSFSDPRGDQTIRHQRTGPSLTPEKMQEGDLP